MVMRCVRELVARIAESCRRKLGALHGRRYHNAKPDEQGQHNYQIGASFLHYLRGCALSRPWLISV